MVTNWWLGVITVEATMTEVTIVGDKTGDTAPGTTMEGHCG